MFLLLGSFVGVVPFDYGMLFIALPSLAVAVILLVIGWTALGDLTLRRPVLTIDETGIFDRRVSDTPIPWSEIKTATSLAKAGGGIVLELTSTRRTRLGGFRMGTFAFVHPEPGIAHVPVRGMTVSSTTLVRAILDGAARAGAVTAEARTHEKMPRRQWML